MRSSIETGLTLLEYCTYMGIDPFTMAQFSTGFPSATTAVCDKPVFQYQWQQDFLSRDEFALAIAEAERRIAEQLGFWTYPYYVRNELLQYPQPANVNIRGGGGNFKELWKSVQLKYGKVQTPGVRVRTLIDANVALTRIDTDGDGVDETFTATFTVPTGTLASEIGLYINAADRVGAMVRDGERWRLRPLDIEIVGTTCNVRGHAALLVKPSLYEGYDNTGLDVSLATNYLTTVSAYRVYTDTTATTSTMNQGSAYWEIANCCGASGVTLFPITVTPRIPETGFVGVDWSQTDCTVNSDPDRVLINYLAGEPLVNGLVEPFLGDVVAKFATALLPNQACGCERSQRIIAEWKKPIFQSDQEDNPAFAPNDAATNTFGVEKGAVYAWRAVQELKQIGGIEL